MATCDECGRMENMPYRCRRCGGTFCADHRLPENHGCSGLDEWNDPGGIFDSGFDDSVRNSGSESATLGDRLRDQAKSATGTGGIGGYVRGNVTYVFLGLMWVWFFVEFFVAPRFGVPIQSPLWYNIFTLNTANPAYVWTWVTSIFSHGGFGHIFVNSIVLYFFGPVVERRLGSTKFTVLFLVSGAVAGLAQILSTIVLEPGLFASVVGASGAIAALLGVLTVLNPNLRIYLYFIIPMPLWVATLLFAGYSVFVSAFGGIAAGSVAQLAHLAGLGVGLVYGAWLKHKGERAPRQLQFGGGPGGPGGPGRRGGGRF